MYKVNVWICALNIIKEGGKAHERIRKEEFV